MFFGSHFDTDKIEPHGYFPSYVKIAAELGPQARVCELGVQNGESLRMWQALFPLGHITGVDIDPAAVFPDGTTGVLAPQDHPGLPDLLGGTFDLIVDDCSHDGHLTQQSWLMLWELVNPGGFYVIEDWQVALKSDPHWGACYGPGMLKTAESFLSLLHSPDTTVEEIIYRYGLIIMKKNKAVS